MKKAIPDAVLEQHTAILGKTGRGKTTTAKVCVEQVYDQEFRVCILDTLKSDWWGITASADGRRPGLPFQILGGPKAHVPLTSNAGKAVADLVARGQLRHTIIDMAEFEPGGQMRFFTDFAPRLMQRMKGVCYLVIEEAHMLAPKERAGIGHENMSIHWAKVLATAGRTKGIRLLILSQRTQAVHNALLGSCDSMIVHGMTAPADMEPVTKWLKANNKNRNLNAQIEGSLSGLPRGEAWVCSSEAGLFERVQMPRARTYDNTRAPTDDEDLLEVKTAPVDLDRLRVLLGKAAAEAEANDPTVLRKRITELEAQLKKPSAVLDPALERKARSEAYREGVQAGRGDGEKVERDRARNYLSTTLGQIDTLRDNVSRAYMAYNADRLVLPADVPEPPKALVDDAMRVMSEGRIKPVRYSLEVQAALQSKEPLPYVVTKDDDNGATVRKEAKGLRLRILGGLRWLEERGIQPAPRATLGGIADFTPDKGYGARTLGEMKTEGLVVYPTPGMIELTDEGRVLAPAPPSYGSLLEAWLAILKGLHREVVVALGSSHPNPVTRDFLGTTMERQFEKGYGARVLGELKTIGAIWYPNPGVLALTQHVMPR